MPFRRGQLPDRASSHLQSRSRRMSQLSPGHRGTVAPAVVAPLLRERVCHGVETGQRERTRTPGDPWCSRGQRWATPESRERERRRTSTVLGTVGLQCHEALLSLRCLTGPAACAAHAMARCADLHGGCGRCGEVALGCCGVGVFSLSAQKSFDRRRSFRYTCHPARSRHMQTSLCTQGLAVFCGELALQRGICSA